MCCLPNVNGSILDLIFLSRPELAEVLVPPHPILPTDRHHKPSVVLLDANDDDLEPVNHTVDPDFARCDLHAVSVALDSVNWHASLAGLNTEDTVSSFYDILTRVLIRHSPRKRICRRHSYRQPWWTDQLRHLRNVLRKARKRYFRTKSSEHKADLLAKETEYAALRKTAFDDYVRSIEQQVKVNPSSFWKFIKSRRNSNPIPAQVSFQDSSSTTTIESANLFAQFFKNVHSTQPPQAGDDYLNTLPSYDINMPTSFVSRMEIITALKAVDPTKGPGPDGIPPSFVLNAADSLADPLNIIFNRSLSEGVFPSLWKTAAVTPIHKAGNIHRVENYRPISILCCLSKVFEVLIYDKLYSAAQPIISDNQHGFLKRRSAVSNLMSYSTTLHTAISRKEQIDAIYIDFAKAFDKVPHELIVRKLERYGFPLWLTNWTHSYLVNRQGFVNLRGIHSLPYIIPSGVPQGSHLGPLLFIIFVNDLNSLLNSCLSMYADDLKIFRTIKSLLDCVALQADVTALLSWCTTNGMEANINKCKCITFVKTRSKIVFDYTMGAESLERVSSIRDLGVVFDEKLNFSEHISTTAAKGFAMLGFICRNASNFEDIYALKTIFCSLVRSVMEYAVTVWAPYHVVQIEKLEKVQRRFLRFALRRLPWEDPIRLPPYADRCRLISLETLSRRRLFLQRMFVYDLLTSKIDCPQLLQCLHLNVPSRRLRHHNFLWIPFSRTTFGQNHPLYQCCNAFNEVAGLFDFNMSKCKFKSVIRYI